MKDILECIKVTIFFLYKLGKTRILSLTRYIVTFISGSGVNILLITPEKAIKLAANDFFRYHLTVEHG